MDRIIHIFSVIMFIYVLLFSILNIVRGEENVALGKTTSQSSTFLQSGSSLAVDGNTDNEYEQGSCSHTNNYGTNWWCVDLQRAVDFQNIKIYNRNIRHYRLQGFEIRLSSNGECNNNGYQQSTVCYKDTSTTTQNIYTIEQCNQPNTGQFNGRSVYISVEHTTNSDKLLTLCEVEIYEKCPGNCKDGCNIKGVCNSCITGYYGYICSTTCPTNCNNGCRQDNGDCNSCNTRYYGNKCTTPCPTNCNNGCQKSNGYCIGGCKPWYSGKSCTECISGYWGNQCQTRCGNCNNGCQKSNGYCIGGCKPWYSGKSCTECISGYWGIQCQTRCSNCNNGCRQDNGDCNYGGCMSGYYGEKCDTSCPTNCNGFCVQGNGDCVTCKDGYWGAQCSEQCPTNCRQSKCNENNGHCISCNNKYWGEKCDKECSPNCKYKDFDTCYKTSGRCNSGCKETWYGDTCSKECSSNCKHSKCDKLQSGLTCTDGCIDGYKGTYCTSCKTGWYGDTCQTKCNGNCINGCDQYKGDCVNDKLDPGSPDGISQLASGIIGAFSVIVIILLMVIFYCSYKRRIDRDKSNESPGNEETVTTPQVANASRVEDNAYESLDRTVPSPTYETLK